MLSWPPWAFAQSTSAPAAASGSSACAAVVSLDEVAERDRVGAVVPEAVAADQHPARGRWRIEDVNDGSPPGLSTPSQRVIEWARGSASATVARRRRARSRRSPTSRRPRAASRCRRRRTSRRGCRRSRRATSGSSTTTATNVHDGGFVDVADLRGGADRGRGLRGLRSRRCTASCQYSIRSRRRGRRRVGGAPRARRVRRARRRAPRRRCRSRSSRRRTRRARCGSPTAASATASSLRGCCTPRSHTAATCGAGCSVKWSRSLGARSPQTVHQPSASISPPHEQWRTGMRARSPAGRRRRSPAARGVACRARARLGVGVGLGAADGAARRASCPHASQNWSVVADRLPHSGSAGHSSSRSHHRPRPDRVRAVDELDALGAVGRERGQLAVRVLGRGAQLGLGRRRRCGDLRRRLLAVASAPRRARR